MKQDVNPGIIALVIIVVVVFIGFMGWKSLRKGGSSGGGANPYANHPMPGPSNYGRGSGGGPSGGRMPGGSGGPSGGMMPGSSGGAPGSGSSGG